MALNKFDQQIKDKLNNRTLAPSSDAWNTLSKRLEDQTRKPKNKSLWWLGLAASVVGVLLVSHFFSNKDAGIESDPIIVNNPQPIKDDSREDVGNQEAITIKKPIIVQEKTHEQAVYVVSNSDTQGIPFKGETVKPEEEGVDELTFEEQKIQDVVAQIQLLTENNAEVTDAEIDALLLKAQKEINLDHLYNPKGLVDAHSLLQEVEADIDQSFRSKVFEALKDSFGTVKSAVANRNN